MIKVFEILRGLKNHELGYIIDSYACCTVMFDVYDHRDQWVYRMSTEWCQKGILCKCPFESCKKVEFVITDARGREVSRAKREGSGWRSNVSSDSDQFKLLFNKDMPWNHRTLLTSAVLFADFRLFEMGAEDNERRHDY